MSPLLFPLCLLLLLAPTSGKSCSGSDLPVGSDTRVGTTLKKKCSQVNRSKPGDWMRVHYETKLYSSCVQISDTRSLPPPPGSP
ncbi:hypothetical protein TrRE_jg10564, partial [Triparma retinervis]